MTTGNVLDINRVLADALINVTQTASQGIFAGQLTDLRCDQKERSQQCVECIGRIKGFAPTLNDRELQSLCAYICECRLEDINQRQVIHANFSAIANTDLKSEFVTSFINSLSLEAKNQNVSLYGLNLFDSTCGDGNNERCKIILEQVESIFEALRSDTSQQLLQSLAAYQIVRLNGPGYLTAVDMEQMIDMVSAVLQSNTEISNAVRKIMSQINQATSDTIIVVAQQLIIIVVMLVTIGIIFTIVGFTISQFLSAAYYIGTTETSAVG